MLLVSEGKEKMKEKRRKIIERKGILFIPQLKLFVKIAKTG